jgi:hypothetical protein
MKEQTPEEQSLEFQWDRIEITQTDPFTFKAKFLSDKAEAEGEFTVEEENVSIVDLIQTLREKYQCDVLTNPANPEDVKMNFIVREKSWQPKKRDQNDD